jgi:hypothetical protein
MNKDIIQNNFKRDDPLVATPDPLRNELLEESLDGPEGFVQSEKGTRGERRYQLRV